MKRSAKCSIQAAVPTMLQKPKKILLIFLGILGLSIVPASIAQTPISSGQAPTGEITLGEMDTWVFSATTNDSILLRVAKLTDNGNFSPRITLYRPNGDTISTRFGNDAEISATAAQSGTYTVVIESEFSGGTGTYQLNFAKIPGAFTIPAGDEGGALSNGSNTQGTTGLGDLDLWTFTATTNDRILLRVAKLTDNGNFSPHITLYRPNGDTVSTRFGDDAEISATAAQSGTYTVLVESEFSGGTGTYQLHFAKIPGAFTIPAGDQGGALVNGNNTQGAIHLGDLDLWTFKAATDNHILLRVAILTNDGNFSPSITLHNPSGEVVSSHFGDGAEISVIAAQSGTYTVVVDSEFSGGTGTYQLFYSKTFFFDLPKADFNSDGKPDWILRRPGTGQIAVWLEDNGTLLGSGYAPTLPAGWTLVDADQFGGGINSISADLLIYNASTHRSAIWYLNSTTLLDAVYGPTLPAGWALLLSQDFNADAKPDLLLYQPSTRRTVIWYLNGAAYAGGANGPTLPSGWIVAGAGDFDRDERADLLLYQSSTRKTAIWYLNGAQFLSGTYGPTLPSGWAIGAVDDFNRDGYPDLALSDVGTHQSAIWHLANNHLLNGRYSHVIPSGWILSAPK